MPYRDCVVDTARLSLGGTLLVACAYAQAGSVSGDYRGSLSLVGPTLVSMVDGGGKDLTVSIKANAGRWKGERYDFGFMQDGLFEPIVREGRYGKTAFGDGVIVDFALRAAGSDGKLGTTDDTVYRASDPLSYANLSFAGFVQTRKSGASAKDDGYYRSARIFWDLDRDGRVDVTVRMTTFNGNDGFAPTAVPLPAAVWLLGPGLVGLWAFARRRRATAS